MEKKEMLRQTLVPAVALVALLGTGTAQAETTSGESRTHEFACTAATVGGAVAGVALGSLLGGGLGRTLFETAGGVAGGMAGHAMKCPK
jgi:outer membrane lipoprotein SlyB